MTSLPVIDGLAALAAWGVAWRHLLTIVDPVEARAEWLIATKAVDRRIEIEEQIATQIGNAVARALGA